MTTKQNQTDFDKKYITGSEIVEALNVSRVAVMNARKRGLLPEPIVIPGTQSHVWVRAEVKEALATWKISLELRYGAAA